MAIVASTPPDLIGGYGALRTGPQTANLLMKSLQPGLCANATGRLQLATFRSSILRHTMGSEEMLKGKNLGRDMFHVVD